MPGPVQDQLPLGEFIVSRKVLIAKTVHVLGYATLAMLTGALPVPWRWRLLLMFVIMFHGAATEFIQQYVERGAAVNDVVLDHLAIGLGCALTWKRWTRSDS